MNTNTFIYPYHVHLWWVRLSDYICEEYSYLLSPEERLRAKRFRFKEHRYHYTIARAVLRQILSLYTGISAGELCLIPGKNGKPYLEKPFSHLQFNLAHSHEMAVYALRTDDEIGVDIEKIENKSHDSLAKRFFNNEEFQAFSVLPDEEKPGGFFRLWTAKEALIKARGESIFSSMSASPVNINQDIQIIEFIQPYYVEFFSVDSEYQSAFATPLPVEKVICRQWFELKGS